MSEAKSKLRAGFDQGCAQLGQFRAEFDRICRAELGSIGAEFGHIGAEFDHVLADFDPIRAELGRKFVVPRTRSAKYKPYLPRLALLSWPQP